MSVRSIYWAVGGAAVALLVVMVASWSYGNRADAAAVAKAEQLISAYQQAGMQTPASATDLARVLGDDGGAVCDTAGSRQQLGYLRTQLGVGGEFYFRPTIVDRRVLKGLLLIVQTYCPEKLDKIRAFVDELRYAGVIRT